MYAVFFDIDGTLLLTGGAGQAAFTETLLEDFGISEFPDGILFAGRSDRAIIFEILDRLQLNADDDAWQQFNSGYCRRLKASLETCSGRLLPGVVELLDQLAKIENVAVGLLTGNIEHGAWQKLEHFGIAERFTFGGFGDDHHDRCDIAAAALADARQRLAERLKPWKGEFCGTMVIGDTVNDIRCARSIGARAAAVATGGTTLEQLAAAEPDFLFPDLTAAAPLLAEVTAAG
jgi:phosphoglycolate phosphatase-like HAD superfamily hydrolase